MKKTLKEIIEISKQETYRNNYVVAFSTTVDNRYNYIVLISREMLEKWYESFAVNFKTIAIYYNGKHMQQPDRMN